MDAVPSERVGRSINSMQVPEPPVTDRRRASGGTTTTPSPQEHDPSDRLLADVDREM
jgi:hypothetical protein